MALLDSEFHVLAFDKLYVLRDEDLPRHCWAASLVLQLSGWPYMRKAAPISQPVLVRAVNA